MFIGVWWWLMVLYCLFNVLIVFHPSSFDLKITRADGGWFILFNPFWQGHCRSMSFWVEVGSSVSAKTRGPRISMKPTTQVESSHTKEKPGFLWFEAPGDGRKRGKTLKNICSFGTQWRRICSAAWNSQTKSDKQSQEDPVLGLVTCLAGARREWFIKVFDFFSDKVGEFIVSLDVLEGKTGNQWKSGFHVHPRNAKHGVSCKPWSLVDHMGVRTLGMASVITINVNGAIIHYPLKFIMFNPFYRWYKPTVNYNISLTWIKAILGWFPSLTIIPSEVAVRSL